MGMSVHHPSATGHGASTSQLWILVLLSPSQRCSLALPIPSPPPVPFTTPFLPLSLPSPHSQRLFLICCSPSPRRRQFCSRVLRIHHRPLLWDSALAGGSGSKLLGWQTSTWAHYSRAGDMVITCLRGSGTAGPGNAPQDGYRDRPALGGDPSRWERGELTPEAEPAPHLDPLQSPMGGVSGFSAAPAQGEIFQLGWAVTTLPWMFPCAP